MVGCRCAVVGAVLWFAGGCDDPKPSPIPPPKVASGAGVDTTVRAGSSAATKPTFRDVDETMGGFFVPARGAAAAVSAAQLVGTWEARIVAMDAGPGAPPVDVSAMPPFQFSLAASGDGYRMTSADGARNVELAVAEGKLMSKQGAASQMRFAVDGQDLVGEIQGNNSVPRTVLRAKKVR